MGDRMDFGMPLDEAMDTQRAIRRLKTDPVDDAVVLRLIDLALRAPTGSNAQSWEFIIVRDPKIKKALGSPQPASLATLCPDRQEGYTTRREEAQAVGCRSMAGGSSRGGPGHCRCLSEGYVHPVLAHLYRNLLWVHFPCCAEPPPGCTRREPRRCPDDNSIVEPYRYAQNPRPTLEHHTMCSHSSRLATRPLRPYDTKTHSRGGVI